VLLHVSQVVAHAAAEERTPPAVDARQLEVDQVRPTILSDEDVLLLVQVVVTDAELVQRSDELIQLVEEVARQRSREVQRFSGDPAADQNGALLGDEPVEAGRPLSQRLRDQLGCPGRSRQA
jgi:hypothetical protein